jgi:hypothetical protein
MTTIAAARIAYAVSWCLLMVRGIRCAHGFQYSQGQGPQNGVHVPLISTACARPS